MENETTLKHKKSPAGSGPSSPAFQISQSTIPSLFSCHKSVCATFRVGEASTRAHASLLAPDPRPELVWKHQPRMAGATTGLWRTGEGGMGVYWGGEKMKEGRLEGRLSQEGNGWDQPG